MSKSKNTVLSNIASLAKSNLFQQIVSLIVAYSRPRFLSPEHFGIWSLFNNILTHVNYLDLGLLNAARYEIPKHQVSGEKEQLKLILGSAFWGMFSISLFIIMMLLTSLYFLELSQEQHYCLLIMIIIILLNVYHNQRTNELRGYQEFRVISATTYLEISLNAVLTVGLVYYIGVYGAFLALTVSMFCSNIFMLVRGTRVTYNRFSFSVLKKLIYFGFPIMMINITELLLKSLDRWVISFYLGSQQLGYYGIGVMVLAPLLNIPGVSRNVIEPLLFQEMARIQDMEESVSQGHVIQQKNNLINRYLLTPMLQTACLTMPVLSGIAYLAIPAFIHIALPKYIQGIEPVQVLIIGSYFLAITFPIQGFVIVNKWQSKVALLTVIPIGFSVLVSILMIKQGMGIVGVSMSSGFSFFLLALLLLSFIFYKLRRYLTGLIWKIVLIILGFPLMIAAIYAAEYFSQYCELYSLLLQTGRWTDLLQKYDDIPLLFAQSVKIMLFLLCFLPLPLLLWRANLLSIKQDMMV